MRSALRICVKCYGTLIIYPDDDSETSTTASRVRCGNCQSLQEIDVVMDGEKTVQALPPYLEDGKLTCMGCQRSIDVKIENLAALKGMTFLKCEKCEEVTRVTNPSHQRTAIYFSFEP